MLNALVEYAREKSLVVEPGFKPKSAKWAIQISNDGKFISVTAIGDPKRGRNFAICPDMPGMNSGGKAHPFLETCGVVTLLEEGMPDGNLLPIDEKTKLKHEFFVERIKDATIAMPEWKSVFGVLVDPEILHEVRDELRKAKAKPNDSLTFLVGEVFPIEQSGWHDWWRNYLSGISGYGNAQKMMCFATGQSVIPAMVHPKVGGLGDVGGQPAGTVFVGFDKDAFKSYGLDKSVNGAVSEDAASAYRAALNDLIQNSGRLLGMKVAYWYKETIVTSDDPLSLALAGDKDSSEPLALLEARKLLEHVRKGGEKAQLGDNHFYALILSGAGGRVMVRDWMQGQLSEIAEAVVQWFEDLSIVGITGKPTKAPSIEHVVTCILPPKTREQEYKDWIKPIGSLRLPLWKAALDVRLPVPRGILGRLMESHRGFVLTGVLEEAKPAPASLSLLYTRMGLIKAYHNRKNRGGYQLKPSLNEDHPSPAYHCGRLMAVLAALQQRALGDVGAGVIQRYYGAASANPGLVLGRLIRLSQHHLGKISGEGEKGRGLARWFENQLAGIHNSLEGRIPKVLNLEEQSYFALGYYQQLAFNRTKKSGNPDADDTDTKTEE